MVKQVPTPEELDQIDQRRIDAEVAYVQGRCSKRELDDELKFQDMREGWVRRG